MNSDCVWVARGDREGMITSLDHQVTRLSGALPDLGVGIAHAAIVAAIVVALLGGKTPAASAATTQQRTRDAASTSTRSDSLPEFRSTGFSLPLIYIEFGLAAAVTLAGGAMLLDRKARRVPVESPARSAHPDRCRNGDLVGGEPNRRSGDEGELGIALAEHLQQFLIERGSLQYSVLMVSQSRKTVTIVLSVSPDEQLLLLQHCVEFTAALRGRCSVSVSPDHDVVVRIPRKALTGLVKPPRTESGTTLPMIPIGQQSKDETLFVNWHELGHMLISGLPGAGADVVLTTLLASLAARFTPEQLQIWSVADLHLLPAQLRDLPHHRVSIDSEEKAEVEATLAKLRAELVRRMSALRHPDIRNDGDRLDWSEILLVLGEIGEIGAVADDRATFDLISAHGARYGMRCVATTAQCDSLSYDNLNYFGSHLVLQLSDDDQSIKLIGRPDASQLGNGEFMLRLGHRAPLRVRGFRIEASDLDGLIRAMHERRRDSIPVAYPAANDDEFNSRTRSIDQTSPQSTTRPPAAGTNIEPIAAHEIEQVAAEATAETEPLPSSLIQIKCFGEFTVTSGGREIVPSGEEGTSYKAWEVLAFLAAQPDGSIAKDRLLTAVWPEVDSQRTSRRLRVAMTRLRGLLAGQVAGITTDAVRTDRDGICRLDTAKITSDVQRFTALCQQGSKGSASEIKQSLQQAVTLYQGDLLAGRGTRIYEWVDVRDDSGISLRERYREAYYQATKQLADLYIEEGHPDLAVPLFKNALKLEPTLEDIVRQLYACYRQLGDLRSLIQEDRALRQSLRQLFYDPSDPDDDPDYYEPEPETVELFNQVRAELEAQHAVNDRRGRRPV